jgi:hypothetical protein
MNNKMSKQAEIIPVFKRKTDFSLASTNNKGEEGLSLNSTGRCAENLIGK